ncbi:hypothetical protein V5799_016080 [Amblyomma americanum]|uniref:Uncharacterized protein n=1 Tax=Amblyomma americanum TaxID=6943 RepID=A0AAQ4F7G5_AMBAM
MESKKPTACVAPRPRAHQGPGNQLRRWGTESSLMSSSRAHRAQGDGMSSLAETTRTAASLRLHQMRASFTVLHGRLGLHHAISHTQLSVSGRD